MSAVVVLAGIMAPAREAAAEEPILVEFHYTPVPDVQMAIWLEDQDGNFVQDVLVTQATGKYGIGNRPGVWNFVSSWRAPYGPRQSVLPVWAHRRGKKYPRIIFLDDNPADFESLGWHENSSSAENYYCRPLTASEHETISVDTKTCPSPKVFQSDKGRFDPKGNQAFYPPRNDLVEFEGGVDSDDAKQYAEINDLDAVTAATPVGDMAEFTTVLLAPEVLAKGPLTAYVEVNLERDENANFDYDREDDHFVDPRLEAYGIEFLGQPSVIYKVAFDPRERAFVGTTEYLGYGDWNGATGSLHPRDGKLSESNGSGADRLRVMTKNGDTFRWGVFSYGKEGGGTTGDGGDDTGDDPSAGSDSDSNGATGEPGTSGDDTGGDGSGGWGQCSQLRPLVPIDDLALAGMSFDRVQVSFRMPEQSDPDFELTKIHVYHITGEKPLTDELLGAAFLKTFSAAELAATTGLVTLEIGELWGDYTYQFAVVYEDKCTNRSPIVGAAITTEAQQFQTVDSFCFVATAAWGAPWAAQVAALRSFRDLYLKTTATGVDLVRFYYAYSPPLARVIQHEPLLRGLARVVLQPVADAANLATRAQPGHGG
ncbi:CFI-box-CTERM domain-containing protein [Nannocystis punicea]|uniref:Uncharacterized protein n=1 Tax=Nannocystis punicea TaxID=2995304 RepID=A0ABY7HCZ8_9BACT|nr:CFI-box-CTERM domain-containing protein [Nannocystis poenicansa]WAS96965.1 hypothetical protein O0S08_12520 [Nannocystis poenicansa]